MLEVKHLVKTYSVKGKGSTVVHALNDVSLKFPDTGLIFILGKSGSGKSTLLNVMGGLDIPDSGEIIIKGKSSKDFKTSDFDSYRNTYLGFIFQEYNILDEFTVSKNISLAIELQGRKSSEAEIDEILKEVDLSGLGSRKPNELSGGQKQRVAIARALVKHPEIIFADEPTGALDSKTGKAVFDTLKKLSIDHLVVVVSHDRDFAEQFGDRVIELKDGQVISDIEKVKVESQNSSKGLNIIDDKVIQIKKGYQVTDDDLKVIAAKIKANTDEKYIVMDDIVAPQIRKISNIDEEGGREVFEKTDETKIQNKPEEFKLIKSKLGFKNSLKIGASALKVKPFRLFLTVLLAFVSFSMFGVVASLASYNRYDALTDSIADSNTPTAKFEKSTYTSDSSSSYDNSDYLFSDSNVSDLSTELGLNFTGVCTTNNLGLNFDSNNYKDTSSINSIPYYVTGLQTNTYTVPSTTAFLSDNGLSILSGSLPTADDEVAITDYRLEIFKQTGYTYTDLTTKATTTLEPNQVDKNSILGKYLDNRNNLGVPLKITAIINTGFIDNDSYINRYSILKTSSNTTNLPTGYQSRYNELSNLLTSSYINAYFISEDNYNSLVKSYSLANYGSISGSLSILDPIRSERSDYVSKILPSDTSIINMTYFGNKTSLEADSEVIMSYSSLTNYLTNLGSTFTDELAKVNLNTTDNQALNIYSYGDDYTTPTAYTLQSFFGSNYAYSIYAYRNRTEITNNGFTPAAINKILQDTGSSQAFPSTSDGKFTSTQNFLVAYEQYMNFLNSYNVTSNPYVTNYRTVLSKPSYLSLMYINEYVKNNLFTFPDVNITFSYSDYNGSDKTYTRKVVGYIDGDYDNYSNCLIINSNDTLKDTLIMTSFSTDNLGMYDCIMAKMPTDKTAIKKLVKYYYQNYDAASNFSDSKEEKATFYFMDGPAISSVSVVNSLFETLSKVLLYCAIGVALFTCLMLFNFISTSISYKRKEIGILRAVGARGTDVFNIFFNESMIIVLFDVILSCIATFAICFALNNFLRNDLGLIVTLLHPGIIQILLIVGVGLVTAFISTFLPVFKAAKKKPIDAIHNK